MRAVMHAIGARLIRKGSINVLSRLPTHIASYSSTKAFPRFWNCSQNQPANYERTGQQEEDHLLQRQYTAEQETERPLRSNCPDPFGNGEGVRRAEVDDHRNERCQQETATMP